MKTKISVLLLLLASSCGPSSLTSPTTTATSESDSETTEGEPATTETEDTGEETSSPKQDQPATVDCDPFAQDCPEGEKCVPYGASGSSSWDANKCVPVTGDREPGESCIYDGVAAGTDDCDATGMCWNTSEVDGQLVGECVPFCLGSPEQPECPEGTYCPIGSDGVVNVCIATCDPVAQDCDAGLGCYWANTEFLCVTTIDDVPLGEPCGFINDCVAGLVCISQENLPACDGPSCCAAFCDLELGDAQCEAVPGTSCVSFFEAGRAPAKYEHVGVCVSP
jgi:hypothetical protein